MRLPALVVLLVAFTGYSVYLVQDQPFFGFLTLARDEPWGRQVLIDLVIALSLFASWMRGDARARKLPYLPYLALILVLGSIGALSYLIHRELRKPAGLDPR